ncbi:PREDICTED: uncharacterized protein LOC105570882 isoform X2 [Vollenhovia emeryi]|uniref:uncharacterized protein LOC105570882 isoform X2 n=1 Tax=Vollenhovia emeryi TaxID=411798 RepID=UPI0005F4B54C|nr:PREDICTED: uncharacterized protein LOC105570882 isoform X2 [Vollenhovia emeryi]
MTIIFCITDKMPYCCITKCGNSWKRGNTMHHLPTNYERREQWIKNIGRLDLDPAKEYYIHFEANMWEKPRVDGKQKLKSTAIPTIFPKKQEDVVSNNNRQCSAAINTEDRPQLEESEHKDIFTELMETIEENTELVNNTDKLVDNIELEEKCINKENNLKTAQTLDTKELQLKLEHANVVIEKQEKSKRMLLKRIKRLVYEKKKLITENHNLKASKSVNQLLNKDQIIALHKKSVRGYKWSANTVRKALRLKLLCGASGYQEILDQGIPLPAARTLRQRCEDLEFHPGICEEVFETLQQRVSQFTDDREKDCMLALDEMSIMAGEQVDHGIMSHVGLSTLPDKSGK